MTATGQRQARSAKLTDEQVIYALQSTKTNRQLADELGVSDSAIQKLRRGESYTWVRPDMPRPTQRTYTGPRCTACVHMIHDRCGLEMPEFRTRDTRAAATCAAFTDQPLRFPRTT